MGGPGFDRIFELTHRFFELIHVHRISESAARSQSRNTATAHVERSIRIRTLEGNTILANGQRRRTDRRITTRFNQCGISGSTANHRLGVCDHDPVLTRLIPDHQVGFPVTD